MFEVQAGRDPVSGHEFGVGVGPDIAADIAVEKPHLHDLGVTFGGDRQVHVAWEVHLFGGVDNLDVPAGGRCGGSR